MPHVLGFDVAVEVEGKKLPEYKPEISYDPISGVPVTTCYVPSEAGKEFCIALVPPPAPRPKHWSFAVKLDGTSPIVNGTALLRTATGVKRLQDELVSPNVVRRFQFATIQLTDDDSALNTTSPDLGSIALLMHSVDDYVRGAPVTNFSNADAAAPVHEKAKKAFVHRVGFGEMRTVAPSNWFTPVGKRLHAMVVFKYRNLDTLIADDIAPGRKLPIARPASPRIGAAAGPSNPRKRKAKEPAVKAEINLGAIEIDSDDEEGALEARLAAVRAKKAKTGDGVRVKTEAKPRLPPSFIPGEVIDLTEDD
ncbi:hypothetical protein BKA70DRAFT_1263022 [Coprinopsis sp. MPI-PUGE-AT-0042]|nr:hypothetical protein BKA70DRAFT_1263022 [Coprinopsis sp. MPI-PUGE-AT-0042]